uniref:Uncharacterized protein n=1 Tax=Trichinella nativa TaxID=6335 RepID=A0A0V1KI15_9BILA
MLGPRSGTVWMCGLVGGSVSLWETLSSSCTMPAWMLPYSCLDDNGLNH